MATLYVLNNKSITLQFYKKLRTSPPSSPTPPQPIINDPPIVDVPESSPPNINPEIEVDELEADPGLRENVNIVAPNEKERDRTRRAFFLKGPFQPKNHVFLIKKDAAFCLCCYLFKDKCGTGSNDSFVGEGFKNWKKPDRFQKHIGDHSSIHNQCQRACEMLMNPKRHIDVVLSQQSEQVKNDYRIQLTAAIDCRYLTEVLNAEACKCI
ncbi:uncharacterized protein LOC141664980 [Apium graveolens]|uniref:uncharacterized protein LOC141664980 n=1 Tax=Apium graveolens TaxID=4045 RepID=UPI003D7AE9DD